MSNLYSAASYKNKIINLLLKNENFIELIDPEPSECEFIDTIDVMLGGKWIYEGKKWEEQGHIFDYNFVNETTIADKTFVFVETDIDNVSQNMFVNFNLYICIFTSKDLVRITDASSPTVKEIKEMGYFASTYANRIDVLCDIVDETLNGTNKIPGIGNVKPSQRSYVTMYCPNNKFYGKCLKYNVTNYNDAGGDNCGN